ncbi:MAG: hypothetical protein ACJ780_04255 [Solirubrobacteraceae bacterium]
MIQQIRRLVAAAVAVAMLAIGVVMLVGGPAYAENSARTAASARVAAKPVPCSRCCLKMDKKTHRCAKYGYRKGKGKCGPKCK